jgi:hypothetical protein
MSVTPWVYYGDCFKMTISCAQAYFQNIFHSFKVVYLLPLIKTSNLKLIINDWQVKGDVRVIFYQKMIGGRLFYVCFNTAFIRNGLLQVNFISYNFTGLGFPLQRSRVGKKITNLCFKGVRIRFRIECWSEFLRVCFSNLQFSTRDLDKVGTKGRSICGPAFCLELLFAPANSNHSGTLTEDDNGGGGVGDDISNDCPWILILISYTHTHTHTPDVIALQDSSIYIARLFVLLSTFSWTVGIRNKIELRIQTLRAFSRRSDM